MKKKQKSAGGMKSDPHAAREAQKYENPVYSREFILQHMADRGEPLTLKQLADELNIHAEQELEALRRRLNAMERDGQVVHNRRGGYGLATKMDLIQGRVIGHADGFGFLVPDEGGEDVFLPARQMRVLLHGDRAVVRVAGVDRRGRREGNVVEVLEHNTTQLVGRFILERGVGFVAPHNKRISQDIIVPADHQHGAMHGQIVVVELIAQPSFHSQPIGKVIEILGDHMAPGMEIDVAIRSYDLPQRWSPAVQAEIGHLDGEVPEAAKQGREDLRSVPLVTIDGADARDFDDAVYCEPHGNGWRLLVAIADVSAYVRAGMALDSAAFERGNSVYFPERVIPMLPEILSNGLCSLNPNVDRLCMVCEMWLDAQGNIARYRFFEAVMRSQARLTYDVVAAILEKNDADLCAQYAALLPYLRNLYSVYQLFRHTREARGAIDFDTVETRIVFGADRKIEQIIPVERNDAHRLIEECMVAANVCAARFLLEHKIPALYRVHEGPSEEKLTDLRAFLGELGLSLGGGEKPSAKHYAKLLQSIQQRPDAHLLQTVLLRSLSQAVYSPDNIGHFGLAHEAYTHFTSPIRRYPDLLVHRAIRHVLKGKSAADFVYNHAHMQSIGEQCSMTERRADEATRDAVSWLKCEYMMDKVGEEFDGIISAVTSFGIFVELSKIYVEGLVHVTALSNDYYHFDPARHRLTGERAGGSYRLGDKIRVRVMRVDLDEKKIDFELAQQAAQPKNKRRAQAV